MDFNAGAFDPPGNSSETISDPSPDPSLPGLSPSERIIAWRLATGRCVWRQELIDALHGNKPCGGALTAENSLRVYICYINRALKALGIELVGRGKTNRGWWINPNHLDAFRDYLAREIEAHVDRPKRQGQARRIRD